MRYRIALPALLVFPLALSCTGCQSPYYADKGALFGGATGAGVGALIGSATGHTGAGAAIGAGVGALTGAAVGSGMDDIEARNRAEIFARTHQQVRPGAVSIPDVVGMHQAGVNEEILVSHIQANGMVAPLQAADLIYLQQQGIPPRVVQAMQMSPGPRAVMVQQPQPVIVEERYYDPYGPGYYHYRPYGPRVSYGVSVSGR